MYGFVDDPDNDNVIVELYVGDDREGVSDRATALLADLNAEHTWPQSLGAETDPAMSDLNIIFPADETANNRRSNEPFGMVVADTTYVTPLVTTPEEQSVLGDDAQGRLVFEPRDSKKGDIARAILYFYVRYNYQRTANFALTNFNIEEATLLEWARQDPPDEYERARNNLVYRAQGNRNPFIDRPDFLDAIADFPN
jgi:endonuclease I